VSDEMRVLRSKPWMETTVGILIAILSCHANRERRRAQLETWLPPSCGPRLDWRFFIGLPRTEEARQEPATIYVSTPDDYHDLPLKTAEAVAWAWREEYEFLFKCDDDTYVRPERLLASGFESHDYSGWTKDRSYAQGGSGYWLSRRAMEVVVRAHLNHHSEDAAIGIALAGRGILPVHDERYQPGLGTAESTPPLRSNDVIALHNCKPEKMRKVHRDFLE
jgi:hypothetical protein